MWKYKINIPEMEQIRDAANAETQKIFDRRNWQRKSELTLGDVKIIIDEYEKLVAQKKDI